MPEPKPFHERVHVWRDEFLLILSLIVFTVLVYALDAVIRPVFTASTLMMTGALLAIIPSITWLVLFYMQDRLEPEPKHFVLGVFGLGALLAAAVGVPLVENFFRVSHWLYTDALTTILGGILVVGFTQEFLKYAAVRYSVYHSDEFDEPTDGVIYATAAGLGYALVLNIQFVISNGGVDLGPGVIRMAVIALAQAAFAGITGYFLGRAKFESERIWWMPLGITLAAIANGLFNWLRGQVVRSGVGVEGASANPWLGLAIAAIVALGVTGIVLQLIRRNIRAGQIAE